MGRADAAAKIYMSKNHRFADVFNYFLYAGRQVIRPENLRDLNTEELSIPYGKGGRAAAKNKKERFRDVFKELACKEDDRAAYLILGIENQTEVHYAMPVKTLLYDAMQYAGQVDEIEDFHRSAHDSRGHNSGEFLSGFYKEDRIKPVITLTILFNAQAWDGPVNLREMMTIQDPEILQYLPDYSIHLIQPALLSAEDLTGFQSDFADVMRFMKLSGDKKQMKDLLECDEDFGRIYTHMSTDAAMVLNECAGLNLEINVNTEVTDMCKAWDDMREECRAEGRSEGLTEGIRKGMAQGIESGEKRIVIRLHRQGRTGQEIADLTGIEAERIAEWTKENTAEDTVFA